MALRVGRELFRLWLVCSVVWIGTVGIRDVVELPPRLPWPPWFRPIGNV